MAKKSTAVKSAVPMSEQILFHLRELIEGIPEDVLGSWKQPRTGGMKVALSLYNKMADGDIQTFEKLFDRAEGKPQQTMETTEKKVLIEVKYDDTPVKKALPAKVCDD